MPGVVPNEAGPFHVYILRSQTDPARTYVGFTELAVKARLGKHNEGGVPSTAPYRPWGIVFLCTFADKYRALEFERYLKSHSGKAFAAKRLL